jgi:hypothetical protein
MMIVLMRVFRITILFLSGYYLWKELKRLSFGNN